MPTYAQNKQYIYNWNEKNKEKYAKYKSNYMKSNKEKYNKYQLNRYYTQKEFKAFRMILLN